MPEIAANAATQRDKLKRPTATRSYPSAPRVSTSQPSSLPESSPSPGDLAPLPDAVQRKNSLDLGQIVIIAGGLGTRLAHRTFATPKILVPVHGRPFAAWLLEHLARVGVREVLLCIGHLGHLVRQAIGDGRAFGLRASYSDEGDLRLGTAGCLRRALPLLAPSFVVTYGDAYLPFDYLSLLRDLDAHPDARGTMAVFRNVDRFDASNVAVDPARSRVLRYEKRRLGSARPPDLDHIDYGATALRRDVIQALTPDVPAGLDEAQRALAAAGELRALSVPERFYEIGSEQGLRDLEQHLSASKGPCP